VLVPQAGNLGQDRGAAGQRLPGQIVLTGLDCPFCLLTQPVPPSPLHPSVSPAEP
jgi:hypothetical protein